MKHNIRFYRHNRALVTSASGIPIRNNVLSSDSHEMPTTEFARATLTVWTSAIWEDFCMMRLVRVGPLVPLCCSAKVLVRSRKVVLVTVKGSRVHRGPVEVLDTGRLCCSVPLLLPWARLVRATAAWSSLQPGSPGRCWSLMRRVLEIIIYTKCTGNVCFVAGNAPCNYSPLRFSWRIVHCVCKKRTIKRM